MEKTLDEVTASHPAVLADFCADWCEPCKWVVPVLSEIEKHFSGKIFIHKVDIDRYPEVARSLHILSVPTLILFRDGKETWRMRGFDTAPKMIKALGELI